jgi:hypothetical protein
MGLDLGGLGNLGGNVHLSLFIQKPFCYQSYGSPFYFQPAPVLQNLLRS